MNNKSSFVDSIPKPLILIITVLFLILTSYSVIQFGLIGIFQEGLKNSATTQIFVDLIISLLFFLAWLREDTKVMNRSFVFWLIITLVFGCFGPLFYLLTRKSNLS